MVGKEGESGEPSSKGEEEEVSNKEAKVEAEEEAEEDGSVCPTLGLPSLK